MTEKHSLEAHFPDITDFEPRETSPLFSFISVFDHWLSEEEAANSTIMFHSLALESGSIADYLEGERRFTELYQSLVRGGIVVARPGPMRRLETPTAEFEKIIRDSLRETYLMDVYFEGFGVRIVGGYDRTDRAIADSVDQLATFKTEVRKFGLHVLL